MNKSNLIRWYETSKTMDSILAMLPGRSRSVSDFVRRSLRQHAQDIAKIGLRIDAIQPARTDQTVQQSPTFTTMVAAEEEIVLFTQSYCP